MVLQNLDRTQWTFAEAYAHVEGVVLSCHVEKITDAMSKKALLPSLDELPAHWLRAQKIRAREQVLVALRDGDLHAQGRLSTTATEPWHSENDLWRLHSGHHKPISPTEWLEGEFNWADEKLTASEWEFIDIRLPRFLVKAIWPDYVPPADVREAVEETAYSPPYLDLMEEAIAYFHLSDVHQEKKEALVEWFRAHRVDGAQAPAAKQAAIEASEAYIKSANAKLADTRALILSLQAEIAAFNNQDPIQQGLLTGDLVRNSLSGELSDAQIKAQKLQAGIDEVAKTLAKLSADGKAVPPVITAAATAANTLGRSLAVAKTHAVSLATALRASPGALLGLQKQAAILDAGLAAAAKGGSAVAVSSAQLRKQLELQLGLSEAANAAGSNGGHASATAGTLGSLFSGPLLGGLFHTGGLVGAGGPSRVVPAAVFANAPRMHSGGFAGLRPDEVPAILQKGERVLSRKEVRSGANGGGTTSVHISLAPELEAQILDKAQGQSVQVTNDALDIYDRHSLPGRVNEIAKNPMVTG